MFQNISKEFQPHSSFPHKPVGGGAGAAFFLPPLLVWAAAEAPVGRVWLLCTDALAGRLDSTYSKQQLEYIYDLAMKALSTLTYMYM